MIKAVGIRFQQDGKILHYNANELEPNMGDYVVAETGRGLDLGEVVLGIHEKEENELPDELPRVVRIATERDIQQATDNRQKEQEAYRICQRKIQEHKLEMKLVSVECSFDRSKMLFYFTANGRVDFRALVKDLASTFKTRIELRQIGVRDEARMLGGLGCCGRPICCGAFLNDFQPVSIKMAKEQNLSLNPTKISGVCGRLMCCLKYEQDQYEETRKRMPRVGREVNTPDGRGTVTELNIVKETVSVRIANGDSSEIKTYSLEQIGRPDAENAPAAVKTEEQQSEELEPELMDPDAETLETAVSDEASQTTETRDSRPDTPGQDKATKANKPKKNRTEKSRPRSGSKPQRDDYEEELYGTGGKPDKRASHPKGNTGRGRGGKDRKLGQPVRRENLGRDPKNTPASQGENAGDNTRTASEPAVSPAPKPRPVLQPVKADKPPRRTNWADAVEKAIQNADHE